MPSSITAVILAGGNATRMDGANKALVSLHNTPLITHVIQKISPQVNEVLINVNRDNVHFAAFNYSIITDRLTDNGTLIGPLAGIHAGFCEAKHDFVLFVPCDMPNLPSNLVQRLLAQLQTHQAEIAVVKSGNDVIPVVCICKKTVLPSLISYLQQGGRKVSTWQKSCEYIEVDFTYRITDDVQGKINNPKCDFANLNSFQDILDYQ